MTIQKKKSPFPRELTKERLLELKARVESDFYDSPAVLEGLVDRLLRSGDLVEASD